MLFNSVDFMIFFPIVVILYYLIPNRFRYIWLLVCSYYFYMCWNVEYVLLLLVSTLITYVSGLLIQIVKKHKSEIHKGRKLEKLVVAGSFLINLTILGTFKYADFFLENIQKVLGKVNIVIEVPMFDLLLPVGISFYIFQALSYTMDVYRGDIEAERNFLRYAVFVSFFPQLVAGPIERTSKLLHQFKEEHVFELQNVKSNLLLMAWGFFMKMVIADRIAIFVDMVYGNYNAHGGWYLIIATILFAFQIYCDFAGYSTIAVGAAGVMGFKLTENFKSPYCATNIKEFWKRWHISLTSWFRDYLYIPLGGNRKGKLRKYVNQMIVFTVSGLWHGAMWSYVVWGALNGLYIVLSDITEGVRKKLKEKIHWNENAVSNKVLSAIITFCMVDFSWIFFRASGTREATFILKSIFSANNIEVFFDGLLYRLGLDEKNFWFMLLTIVILLVVDICHMKGIRIRKWLEKQNLWFRWLFYIVLIESIVVFGVWGVGYDKSAFIYFQF